MSVLHRGLDRLLATAEQQRLRQMKRIYLMQRHAEKQAALARAQREKEAKDRLREQATEAAAQRARAERQLQEALAEVPPHPSRSDTWPYASSSTMSAQNGRLSNC